jgi:hypothetical protein
VIARFCGSRQNRISFRFARPISDSKHRLWTSIKGSVADDPFIFIAIVWIAKCSRVAVDPSIPAPLRPVALRGKRRNPLDMRLRFEERPPHLKAATSIRLPGHKGGAR